MPTTAARSAGRPAELRIALVLYGGVSLAVYMHGVTKELHKLVRASRAFDADPTLNPFPETGSTERHYFETLADLAERGRPLSVTIDIISGTSAGGINGVVLAKALAVNAEQEQLKRLWIDEGDLRKLLRTKMPGGLRTKAVFAIFKQLANSTKPTSPLKGERMSELLSAALTGMDEGRGGASNGFGATPSLVPTTGRLELFVTTTDLNGFEMLVPSGIGGASQRDRYHAQVVRFDTDRGGAEAEFGPDGNPALAFSARATSSFPGAFAPVSATSFGSESGMPVPDLGGGRLKFEYDEPGLSAQTAWFADGGILDNAPFDHVIDAIAGRRAESEVLRKIIYIQPDPGRALGTSGESDPEKIAEKTAELGWVSGLLKVNGVKGSHPILRELLTLRDMNLRIAQVGDIATRQMAEMEEQIGVALARPSWSAAAAQGEVATGADGVQAAIDAVRDHAAKVLQPTWATYQRLKVDAVGRRLADEISQALVYPRDSSRSSFVRAAIAAWARTQPAWTDADPADLGELLRGADIPYRERRVLFLLAGINELYHAGNGPSRASLDTLKEKAWQLLEDLRTVTTRTIVDTPRRADRLPVRGRPGRLAARRPVALRATCRGQRGLREALLPLPRRPGRRHRRARRRCRHVGRSSRPAPGTGPRSTAAVCLLATSGSRCGTPSSSRRSPSRSCRSSPRSRSRSSARSRRPSSAARVASSKALASTTSAGSSRQAGGRTTISGAASTVPN